MKVDDILLLIFVIGCVATFGVSFINPFFGAMGAFALAIMAQAWDL